jgi:hypothetical protein
MASCRTARIIRVERATQPGNQPVWRKARGPLSDMAVRAQQNRRMQSRPISARDCSVIVSHDTIRPTRIGEAALAAAGCTLPGASYEARRIWGAGWCLSR